MTLFILDTDSVSLFLAGNPKLIYRFGVDDIDRLFIMVDSQSALLVDN
jgi:hypothetical protein